MPCEYKKFVCERLGGEITELSTELSISSTVSFFDAEV